MAKFSKAKLDVIRRMAPTHSVTAIAEALGVHRHSVNTWAKQYGIPLLAKRTHRNIDDGRFTVPWWVPVTMRAEYQRIAVLHGEEEAAAWARAEKRRRGMPIGVPPVEAPIKTGPNAL